MAAREDILSDGRLTKQIISEGTGPRPTRGQRVQVHYETTVVQTGVQVDSSHEEGEPFEFVLGDGDVLEAWDVGVATMRGGETSDFIADCSLAYGEDGAGDDIPPGAMLKFRIELLTGRATDSAKMAGGKLSDDVNLLKRAEDLKEKGNLRIKASEFTVARQAYEQALQALASLQDNADFEALKARNKLKFSCLLNLAHASTKVEDHAAAIRHATDALEIDAGSCKAFYRRGVARMNCGLLQEAREDLLEASRLEPSNREARARLEECKHKMVETEECRRFAYGGMFGKAPEQRIVQRSLANLPKVWLELQIGNQQPQRLCIALYRDTAPRTAENFRALCTGECGVGLCGQPLHYKNTLVHKVVPKSLIEAGDLENYDGSGGESVHGRSFPDEGFADLHHKRGLLSMVNRGPDTNDSRFFITLRSLPQFNGKHVVFGEVVGDSTILDKIEAVETKYPDQPVTQVALIDCGEVQVE